MRRKMLFLAAGFLAAFGLAGCNGLRSLTEPPDDEGLTGPYTFSLSTNLSNTAGTPTIIDAQILIDNIVVADSCPQQDEGSQTDGDGNITYFCEAPASAEVDLGTGGHIGPGMHTVLFFISSQTASAPTPYTVMAFSIQVNDAQGNPLKTLSLPAQSASLRAGQSIVYQISI
ncbi:MAG TPA: hypothetical protein VGG20_14695 [Thermoanaerobaculia bacterium]|jgi:hypothetical protein